MRGGGDGQFDFVDRAGRAVEITVTDAAFQAEVAYDESNPDPQNSGARLSRLTPVQPGANFMVLRTTFDARPKDSLSQRQAILNLVVGENFRATPFNPAREDQGGEGPAFVSLSLAAANSANTFMFFFSRNQKSAEFTVEEGPDGTYSFLLVAAFNSGAKEVEFDSPSGKVAIPPGTFSIWVGNAAIWIDVPAPNPAAKLDQFSFGLGRGSDVLASEGRKSEGVFRLSNIRVLASTN